MVNARNSKVKCGLRIGNTKHNRYILVPASKCQGESATVIQGTSQLWLIGQRRNPDP